MYTDRLPLLLFDSDCIQFIIMTILLYAVYIYRNWRTVRPRNASKFLPQNRRYSRTTTIGICKGVAGLDTE